MSRAFEAPYVKRALAASIAQAAAPVVVLEGPRGAGKTTLVRNEPAFRGFHYVSLADESVLAGAVVQPREWVASLRCPVIIDDAHRVAGLLDAVRQVAAEQSGAHPAYLLVSSQTLPVGEEDDGSPQPQRFTLFPLTQAELCEREGCLIDDLFDRDPQRDFRSSYLRSDLRTMMRIGGFPRYAAEPGWGNVQEHSVEVQEEMRAMLHDGAGPVADIDRSIERSVLKKVLTNPGLCLGVGALARACYVDSPTMKGYLDAFAHRFLVHRLAGLDSKRTRGYAGARTRVHPIDTTFAIEALRAAGRDIAVEPSVFGKVLRVLCMNQLVPAVQWASEPTACRHWRKFDRRVRAVDLVLVRGERLVGVKVRNCATVRSDTIGAMRFLAEDERFDRGFIVYMGPLTLQLAENIWAVPVSALWEREAFWPPAEGDAEDADEVDDPLLEEESDL